MTFAKSFRSAAAVVLNGDLAVFPTQPTSPHMFTVRSVVLRTLVALCWQPCGCKVGG